MSRPFVKAGLLGGLLLVVFELLSLVPVLGCLSLPLMLIGYLVAGALAAYWLPPRREAGRAAGQGALAGLIAGAIGGLLQVVLTPLSIALIGGTEQVIAQLPPETLSQLQQAGIDPNALFGSGTFAGIALLCCFPTSLLIGAALGALGGLVCAAARPE